MINQRYKNIELICLKIVVSRAKIPGTGSYSVLTNDRVTKVCSLCGLSAFLVYLAVNDETPNYR